jgi:hypothetical protein
MRDTAAGAPEVLEIGDPRPPRYAVAATVGALCLALGVGFVVARDGDRDREVAPAPTGQAVLSAATLTANRHLLHGPRYLVKVQNLGDRPVRLERLEVVGWEDGGWDEAVPVPPRSWATAPLAAAITCGDRPPTRARVVVHGTVGGQGFEQVLPLGEDSRLLRTDWLNRCRRPAGAPPTAGELEGTWVVSEGDHLDSLILLQFLPGRRLVLEDGTTSSIYNSGMVVGRFTLSGGRLQVDAETGYHCRFGDRWEWTPTLAEDGRLHLRLVDAGSAGCRRDLGEAWVAERWAPSGPSTEAD